MLALAGLGLAVPTAAALLALPAVLPWRERVTWLLANHALAEAHLGPHGPPNWGWWGATVVDVVEHPAGVLVTVARPQTSPDSLAQLVGPRLDHDALAALRAWRAAGTPLLVAESLDGELRLTGPEAQLGPLRWRGAPAGELRRAR